MDPLSSSHSKMYFIALVLPPGINEKIVPLKLWMLEHFGCSAALRSPAHITLIPPFWMDGQMEAQLIADLEGLAISLQPFHLSTHDFSAFAPRTIFIALQQSGRLHDLRKTVNEFFTHPPRYPLKTDPRPFHPHITIANRDLRKKSFFEAWPQLERKSFRATWKVDSISVLRHNKKNWDVLFTSQFKNL